jgi:hypothetical protein
MNFAIVEDLASCRDPVGGYGLSNEYRYPLARA